MRTRRLREGERPVHVDRFQARPVIPHVVVLAEIRGSVKDDVASGEGRRKGGYVLHVASHELELDASEEPLRFLLGSHEGAYRVPLAAQRPDQVVAE
jgi:hypothetical protein